MGWMNEYDVEDADRRFSREADEFPNCAAGAATMVRLVNWTNRNSDGWPYWKLPSNASAKLQDALMERLHKWDAEDMTEADLKKCYSPIKAFLTKRKVDHRIIFPVNCTVCGNVVPGDPATCAYCANQHRLAEKRAEAVTAIENRWHNESDLGVATTHDLAVMAVEALTTIGAL